MAGNGRDEKRKAWVRGQLAAGRTTEEIMRAAKAAGFPETNAQGIAAVRRFMQPVSFVAEGEDPVEPSDQGATSRTTPDGGGGGSYTDRVVRAVLAEACGSLEEGIWKLSQMIDGEEDVARAASYGRAMACLERARSAVTMAGEHLTRMDGRG